MGFDDVGADVFAGDPWNGGLGMVDLGKWDRIGERGKETYSMVLGWFRIVRGKSCCRRTGTLEY